MPIPERVQSAVDTWVRWSLPLQSPPRVIKPLVGGLTNQSYLVNADGRRLVLRVNAHNSAALGIDRHREQTILAAIAGQDFVPLVVYCAPHEQLLVMEYVEGAHWSAHELAQSAEKRTALIALLERIHQCAVAGPMFDYATHVRQYWQQLCAGQAPVPMQTYQLYRELEPLLDSFQTDIRQTVLCHHDLSPANIVEDATGRLLVLDWEFAGCGEPLMDFATLAQAWGMVGLERADAGSERWRVANKITQFLHQIWPLLVPAGHCSARP